MFVRERDHLWRLWCILSGEKLLLDEYLEIWHLVLFWINIYYRVIRCSFLTFLSYRDLIQNFSFLLFQWKSPTEVLLRTQRNYDSRLVGMIQYYFSCDGILWFYFTVEITGVIFLVGALKSGWSGWFSKSKLEYWVLFYCCLVISGCRAPDFRGVRGSGTTCFLLSSQPAGV